MNLRNWSRGHTFGLLIGLISPLLVVPLIILLYALIKDFYFIQLWNKFVNNPLTAGKFISLAIILNLLWFYLFLNREKYPFAMGIILGTILYLPYILYVNVF